MTTVLRCTVYLPLGKMRAGGDAPTLGLLEHDLHGLSFAEAQRHLEAKDGCDAFLPDLVTNLLPTCYVATELFESDIEISAKMLMASFGEQDELRAQRILAHTAAKLRKASQTELNQAMAYRYYAPTLFVLADGGISAFGTRVSLLPSQVEQVLRQVARHPAYRPGHTLTCQTTGDVFLTLSGGKISRTAPDLDAAMKEAIVAGKARVGYSDPKMHDSDTIRVFHDLKARAEAVANPPAADPRPKRIWAIHLHEAHSCQGIIVQAADAEGAKKLAREWTFEGSEPVLNRSIVDQDGVAIVSCEDITDNKQAPKIVHA